MWLSLTSAPTGTPISLAEAKAQLRIDFTDDDAYITALIAAATARLDGRAGILGRALLTQTWEYRFDTFPDDSGPIELPFPPLVSVTSLKYLDGAGAEQTLAATTDYVVDKQELVGRIRLAYGQSWPDARAEEDAVRVVFVAGYGAATDVPAPIRHALLLMVSELYANREPADKIVASNTVDALLAPFKMRIV